MRLVQQVLKEIKVIQVRKEVRVILGRLGSKGSKVILEPQAFKANKATLVLEVCRETLELLVNRAILARQVLRVFRETRV